MFDHIRRIGLWLVAPGATIAAGLGVALLIHHGSILLPMRWLQVKLALLVVVLPAIVGVGAWLVRMIDEELTIGEPDGPRGLIGALRLLILVDLAVVGAIIWLGRHKPRLGQNVARALGRPRPDTEASA